MNENLKEEELTALESASSEKEWNAACDAVKRARGGAYPGDWFPRVILAGLLETVAARWARR